MEPKRNKWKEIDQDAGLRVRLMEALFNPGRLENRKGERFRGGRTRRGKGTPAFSSRKEEERCSLRTVRRRRR